MGHAKNGAPEENVTYRGRFPGRDVHNSERGEVPVATRHRTSLRPHTRPAGARESLTNGPPLRSLGNTVQGSPRCASRQATVVRLWCIPRYTRRIPAARFRKAGCVCCRLPPRCFQRPTTRLLWYNGIGGRGPAARGAFGCSRDVLRATPPRHPREVDQRASCSGFRSCCWPCGWRGSRSDC